MQHLLFVWKDFRKLCRIYTLIPFFAFVAGRYVEALNFAKLIVRKPHFAPFQWLAKKGLSRQFVHSLQILPVSRFEILSKRFHLRGLSSPEFYRHR